MIGWRERIVLLLLSVLSGTFSLSTAWMSQEQRSQQAQRKHVGIIRGGGLGTETSEGLVGVGIGRSSPPLGGAHLGSSAGGTADAGATATDPSERVCWKTERRVFKKNCRPCFFNLSRPSPTAHTPRRAGRHSGLACLGCALHSGFPSIYRAHVMYCRRVCFPSASLFSNPDASRFSLRECLYRT